MRDVIVIGGGPSGLYSAYKLSEAGFDVLVLDTQPEIGRHMISTGIVSREAFERFNLCKDAILKDVRTINIVSPHGSSVCYRHPHVLAYVVDRHIFDGYIAELCKSKGAKIRSKSEVLSIEPQQRKVEVSVKRENGSLKTYAAKMAVLATGLNLKLSKMLGLGFPKNFLYGVNAHIGIEGIKDTTVYIGNNVSRGAFTWLVPLDNGVARIGLMTMEKPESYFRRFMKTVSPGESRSPEVKAVEYKPMAQGLVSKTYADRVIAVGEAAGQVKTTTGGGIYYGLLCSEIASQVLSKALRQNSVDSRTLSEYEKLWHDAIGDELIVGCYLREVYSKLTDQYIDRLFGLLENDGIIRLLKRELKFDWHSGLILSLVRSALRKKVSALKIWKQLVSRDSGLS